jgi:hypothetical protein
VHRRTTSRPLRLRFASIVANVETNCDSSVLFARGIPTDDSLDDYRRGERYGQMVLDAMEARSEAYGGHKLALSIAANNLKRIIESMISDGIARRIKGGQRTRTPVTSAMRGFLSELTRHIAGIER